jgi:hypothetical protein
MGSQDLICGAQEYCKTIERIDCWLKDFPVTSTVLFRWVATLEPLPARVDFRIVGHSATDRLPDCGEFLLFPRRRALTAALNYSKERKQFGKAIGEFQAIHWALADMATAIVGMGLSKTIQPRSTTAT